MGIGWTGRLDAYYRRVIQKDNDRVFLDADMIRLLIAVDESKNLYQISEEVDLGKDAFNTAMSKLLEQGLIEPVGKDSRVLNNTFLDALRINLSKAIGPMAEILIEDLVAETKLNPLDIAVNQAAELIARLSLEIFDEDDRIQFKKSMIAILNKIKS